eukprot:TRINITY_DN145703_c0_g1_i1.p1 TRINITY_DN145703_c0_g1~~TRINITY_DN145703_c0_g1_i1.p1  ORF type:complete len:110 (+),score=10.00 TRINITY_DN145703_c0_g1_i1:38-331(+)
MKTTLYKSDNQPEVIMKATLYKGDHLQVIVKTSLYKGDNIGDIQRTLTNTSQVERSTESGGQRKVLTFPPAKYSCMRGGPCNLSCVTLYDNVHIKQL